jgi:hypothetical protein
MERKGFGPGPLDSQRPPSLHVSWARLSAPSPTHLFSGSGHLPCTVSTGRIRRRSLAARHNDDCQAHVTSLSPPSLAIKGELPRTFLLFPFSQLEIAEESSALPPLALSLVRAFPSIVLPSIGVSAAPSPSPWSFFLGEGALEPPSAEPLPALTGENYPPSPTVAPLCIKKMCPGPLLRVERSAGQVIVVVSRGATSPPLHHPPHYRRTPMKGFRSWGVGQWMHCPPLVLLLPFLQHLVCRLADGGRAMWPPCTRSQCSKHPVTPWPWVCFGSLVGRLSRTPLGHSL